MPSMGRSGGPFYSQIFLTPLLRQGWTNANFELLIGADDRSTEVVWFWSNQEGGKHINAKLGNSFLKT